MVLWGGGGGEKNPPPPPLLFKMIKFVLENKNAINKT